MKLTFDHLEDRLTPATLDIVGGALTFVDAASEANNLTVAVGAGVYAFNDSATPIVLGSGATAAGWKGSGTNTASGPASAVDSIGFSVGSGTDTVNYGGPTFGTITGTVI